MANSSTISLPREKCLRCLQESDILLSSHPIFGGDIGLCYHKFCQSCFIKENKEFNLSTSCIFKCPCCHLPFYDYIQSIDEAILIGEAITLSVYLYPTLILPKKVVIETEKLLCINEMNKVVVEKLESALILNPTNIYTLYFLFHSNSIGHRFLATHDICNLSVGSHNMKSFDYSLKLLDSKAKPLGHEGFRSDCCYEVAVIFYVNHNYPAALKYAKLAYEHCLRSSDHSEVSYFKAFYQKSRAAFAELPPLRFVVGDEVEFLHELESGSEWKDTKVVELYYWDRDFDVHFSAPYRLQLLDGSDSADQPAVYAWVKADIDRYVRKVGVRSIEDTRYQAQLDAKVEELAQVYCSEEFIQDIYTTLAQDHEFVEMLQSVWEIKLSEDMLGLYRLCVMYKQSLVSIDSGYHVPSSEEVIAGIRAFFDPAHLSSDAAPSTVEGEDRDLQRVRAEIIKSLQISSARTTSFSKNNGIQGYLVHGIICCIMLSLLPVTRSVSSAQLGPSWPTVKLYNQQHDFTVPLQMSKAISKVSSAQELLSLVSDYDYYDRLVFLLSVWIDLHTCLENPVAGPACECPFVYFFVKYCLEQGMGVPKLALAIYDRMNMQLSREFIRCANPTCELNRLDKSTRHVRFKKCSRCLTVIYCSRECQTAHYPEHKPLCKEDSTGLEGS